jgi:dolichol-phosphate mannosyltransferase
VAKVILALPAYNEADNLVPLVNRACEVFEEANLEYHILVVNDGSTDRTGEVLEQLERTGRVQVVTHPQNMGLGAAIKTGINVALQNSTSADDIVVNMDADDTHDPAYIPTMAERIWGDGYDVVIASRYQAGSEEVGVPFFRRLLSRGARLVFQMFLKLPEVRDYTCGYRAYRASLLCAAVERFGDGLITRQGFACTDELLVRLSSLSKKMTEIPFVLRYDKKRGSSKLPLVKTIIETLKMLLLHR